MFCQSCGTKNPENGRYCINCGQALNGISQNAIPGTPSAFPDGYSSFPIPNHYASFWKRVGASLIDTLIMMVSGAIIGGIFGFFLGIFMTLAGFSTSAINSAATPIGYLLGILLNWLYFAIMESSSQQASLGKMALGIKVTDMNGQRIGFGKATARFFVKILFSGGLTLGIGYIMAAFTQKTQTLHDKVAGTLVLNK